MLKDSLIMYISIKKQNKDIKKLLNCISYYMFIEGVSHMA